MHEKLAIGPTVVLEILTIARRHQSGTHPLSEGVYLVAYSVKAYVDTTGASYMKNTSVLHKLVSRI